MYVHCRERVEEEMKKAELRRRSFFVDDRAVRKAKKVLCVATDSEAIRQAVERVAEMEEFWKFMR